MSFMFYVLKMRHIRAFFYVMSLRLALLSNSLLALLPCSGEEDVDLKASQYLC